MCTVFDPKVILPITTDRKAYVLVANEAFTLIQNFATDEEIAALNAAEISSPDAGRLSQSTIAKLFEERVARLSGIDLDFLEPLTVVHGPGGGAKAPEGMARAAVLYLNDVPEGEGETCFPTLGYKFVPQKGMVVSWAPIRPDGTEDPNMTCEALAPKSGESHEVHFYFSRKFTRRSEVIEGPKLHGYVREIAPLCPPKPVPVKPEEQEAVPVVQPTVLVDVKTLAPTEDYESGKAANPLKAWRLQETPKITLLPCFSSTEENEHLLELARDLWEPSECVGEDGHPCRMTDVRTSYSVNLLHAQTPIVQALEERAARVAGVSVDFLERVNMVRYSPGEYFKLHHDGTFRTRTVFLYLNDMVEPDEGLTNFPQVRVAVLPRKGLAITFPNITETGEADTDVLHEGQPPRSCTKYGVNFFFSSTVVRTAVAMPTINVSAPEISVAKNEQDINAKPAILVDPQDIIEADLAERGQSKKKGKKGKKDAKPGSLLGEPKAYPLKESDKFQVIPNFLSDEEIQHMLGLAENIWVRSEVTTVETDSGVRLSSDYRTSYSGMLNYTMTPMMQSIEERMCKVCGVDIKYLERLNIVRYTPGQYFKLHHDGHFRSKTAFLYLNDLPAGDEGETHFPQLGLKFVPRKGLAVTWANVLETGKEDLDTVHQGLPPKTATKYGVNFFFNIKPLRELEAQIGTALPEKNDPNNAILIDPLKILPPCARGVLPRLHVLSENANYQLIRDFISDSEIEHILSIAQDLWAPSEVTSVTDDSVGNSLSQTHRTSYSGLLEYRQTPVVQAVEERMAKILGEDINYLERLNVVRYLPGEYFKVHHDGKFRPRTAFLYLNELPDGEGGETHFPNTGLKFKARKGCVLTWKNLMPNGAEDMRQLHQGLPPTGQNIKYGVNFFFNEKPLRTMNLPKPQRPSVPASQQPTAPEPTIPEGGIPVNLGPELPPVVVDPHSVIVEEEQSQEKRTSPAGKSKTKHAGLKGKLESPGLPAVYTLPENPRFSIIPHFVSDAEIDHLLTLSKDSWAPSQVTSPTANDSEGNSVSTTFRTSSSGLIDYAQTPTVKRIEVRLACLCGMSVDYLERLSMVRYQPGEFFKLHHDGLFRPKTAFLYLNDIPDDDEGETHFPQLGLKFKPRKGCVIVWDNLSKDGNSQDFLMVHQGCPPRTACKYGVNFFFNTKPLRKLGNSRPPVSNGAKAA